MSCTFPVLFQSSLYLFQIRTPSFRKIKLFKRTLVTLLTFVKVCYHNTCNIVVLLFIVYNICLLSLASSFSKPTLRSEEAYINIYVHERWQRWERTITIKGVTFFTSRWVTLEWDQPEPRTGSFCLFVTSVQPSAWQICCTRNTYCTAERMLPHQKVTKISWLRACKWFIFFFPFANILSCKMEINL